MKILMINSVCGIRSTGRICTDLAVALEKQGHEVKIAYGRESVPEQFERYAIKIGSKLNVKMHGIETRFMDNSGFGSKNATIEFIEWIKKFDPDIIHIHNIHGYYINIKELFKYLKICQKKIYWTLHDCWSFTGHCAYFDYVGCEKWKECCFECVQKKEYPTSYFMDNSKRNYILKKEIFTHVPNMIIIVPSVWLFNLVKQSFLKEYKVTLINNGVDTNVFRPKINKIREKYHCENKKIILGVASVWDRRKGLDSFLDLSTTLDERYQIILIGLRKKQLKNLPKNIIGIERTDSVEQLAEYYSAADVFVNPTLEDNYPTTNLEAISCGTPVVTYNTGGSGESASTFGVVVPKNNIEELKNKIIEVVEKGIQKTGNINDKEMMLKLYINLFKNSL